MDTKQAVYIFLSSVLLNWIQPAIAYTHNYFETSQTGRFLQSPTRLTQTNLAQATPEIEGECRLVNRQMGIYEEPRVDSPSLGVVPPDQVVLLGRGSDRGWARILAPTVGWIDASNLRVVECPANLMQMAEPTAPARPINPPQQTTQRDRPSSSMATSTRPAQSSGRPATQRTAQPMARPVDSSMEQTSERPASTPRQARQNTCAIVTYAGTEGLAIFSQPNPLSAPIGNLPSRSRLRLSGATVTDDAGRGWAEIILGDQYGWIAETGAAGPSSGFNIRRLPCREIVG
jgi:hypothetical protein